MLLLLVELQGRIYDGIRSVDQNHIIIMEDGYFGNPAFPDPITMGWENIMYSFHYYTLSDPTPNTAELYMNTTVPQLKEYQLTINTPYYIGEFNTEPEGQSGIPTMIDYFRTFTENGWSWTIWNYKRVNSLGCGNSTLWGLRTNNCGFLSQNIYTQSSSTLESLFPLYNMTYLDIQTNYELQ